ncbi:hypothetical protein D3Z41_14725 [Parabacteroides distasonis]|nr:hypothetical protein [Parabacteroides distasonis]
MSFFAFQPLVLNGKNIEDCTACQIVMQIGKSLRFGYTICKRNFRPNMLFPAFFSYLAKKYVL